MYGLRKIYKDGKHYDFTWPLEVGAVATAPDWNSEAECGGGLHMLPNATGDYDLLEGDLWAIVEFDEATMVQIGEDKAKVPECKIVYLSEVPPKFTDWFTHEPDSRNAYYWAREVGDTEYMKQFITESRWAYYWAMCVCSDIEYMKQFIAESRWAYYWARDIGAREHMKQFVIGTDWAWQWLENIGDI